jgi:branched-chain amino acid transport system permease protein
MVRENHRKDSGGAGITRPRPAVEGPLLSTFMSQVVNGLILGSLIGLIALGYTVVNRIIQLINFARGEVFMFGAYGGLAMFTYLLPTVSSGSGTSRRRRCWSGMRRSQGVAVVMERFE